MRLEVNGENVDVSDQLIAISRSAINVENITERKIDITNRFDLPDTANNRRIFDSGQLLGSSSKGFDKTYPAKLIDQDFIFNGLVFVREYTNRLYKIQLSERSKSLFDSMNDKLSALDFEQFDFVFNSANYDALKQRGVDNIWTWPVISMHKDNTVAKSRYTPGDDGLKYSRPCINYKKLLDSIFKVQGWSLSYNEDILNRLALSTNHKDFLVTSYQKTLTQLIAGSGGLTGLDTNDFNNGVIVTGTSIDIGTLKTKFRLRGTITTTSGYKIQIQGFNGTDTIIEEFTVSNGVSEVDFSTKDFKTTNPTHLITINVIGTGQITFNDTLFYSIIAEDNFGDLSTNPLLDYRVKVHDNLPSLKQIEVFRNLLLMTNAIIEPDSLSKVITLKSLNKLSKNNSVDWSEKFETGSESVTTRSSDLAQTNNLIYKNDDTVFSDLGESNFPVDNESLQDVSDFIELIFGASNEIELNSFTTAEFSIYNDTKRETDINPRIIYLYDDDEITPVFSIGRFTELDWRALAINYYKNWFESFRRYRPAEGLFDLKKLDVIGFDFMKLVYLDQFKSSFFVFEIEDFIPGRLTTLAMLKFL